MHKYLERNIGVLTAEQMERLQTKTVAIAGVGGVGGLLAERLSRTGIGALRLADPDTYQPSDMNRQFGCTSKTIGEPKVEVQRRLLEISAPLVLTSALPEGVSRKNVDEFVRGADLIACEIHTECFEEIVAVCEAGRSAGIPVIATSLFYGFGAAMCVFMPEGPEPRKVLNYLHWRRIEKNIARKQGNDPSATSSCSPACAVAAGIGSAEILMYLAGVRDLQVVMPQMLTVDPKNYSMHIIDLEPLMLWCESAIDTSLQADKSESA